MARIVYSALIEKISGSIGGTTFQANSYGYTVKKKPNIIHPNSFLQNRQKAYLALAVREWGQLTDAQRTDWNTWSSTYLQYARHNPSAQLSGFAVFVRTHVFRFMDSLAVDTNPTYSLADADTVNAYPNISGGVLTLGETSTTEDNAWNCLFSVSRPLKASTNFIGTKPLYIASDDNAARNITITNEYTALFGRLPLESEYMAVSIQMYNPTNGQIQSRHSRIHDVTAF